MASSVEYFHDGNGLRANYTNLYYFNQCFNFLTTENIELKSVQITNEYMLMRPKLIKFEDTEKLNDFIKQINFTEITNPTGYAFHYYDWNIAHGLYDTLYPCYLSYLKFFEDSEKYDKNSPFNIFIYLKHIPGWIFQGTSSREWTLEIFKKFCGGYLICENSSATFNNIKLKFSTLFVGQAFSGLSCVNKKAVMPGKENYALEKFRDRMYLKYNIQNNKHNNITIRIIHSNRYSLEQEKILMNICNSLKSKGYDTEYIYWAKITSFKQQLTILNNTDIHISGPGTSMLNFPFLKKDKIHINIGANPIVGVNIPGLMEINIMLLSNEIICDYYNIMEYKNIIEKKLSRQIEYHIDNLKTNKITKTNIPKYVSVWKEYCEKENQDTIDNIISRMIGITEPHLRTYRWIECLVYNDGPFNDSNLVNMKLLKEIKEKYLIK